MEWITVNAQRPAVVNMSLGLGSQASQNFRALDEAIERSMATGLVYVLSARNESEDACDYSPARVSSSSAAITVGATNNTDNIWPDSNQGKCVDIFAPGVSILSAGKDTDSDQAVLSGTSMSAPHVTGAVARYLETHPNATPSQVKDAILNGATEGVLKGLKSETPNLLLYIPPTETAEVRVGLTPTNATLRVGGTQTFDAVVTGASNGSVTWTSDNDSIVTISSAGVATAIAIGSTNIKATSVADSSKSANARVTVTAKEIIVTIEPKEVTLQAGEKQQFTATVSGTDNTSVKWKITGGSIDGKDNTITITASPQAAIYELTATSAADPGQSAIATITVVETLVKSSLQVNISAPNGVTPQIIVNGPSGFTKQLNSTTTLTDLPLGNYTIIANDVTTNLNGSIIDTAYSAEGSTVVVSSDKTTTANVNYSKRSGSERLWIAIGWNEETEYALNSFEADLLAASGTPNPTSKISGKNTSLDAPLDIAFDAKGNLWAINFNVGSIVKFTPTQQESAGDIEPDVIINSPILEKVSTLTFDAEGNLWAGTYRDYLVKFTPSQLVNSGSPEPAITINRDFKSGLPSDFAFDSEGNLWIGIINGNGVVMHSKEQLAQSGDKVAPTAQLGGFSNNRGSIAFDAQGNLWVGSILKNLQGSILKFNKDKLANPSKEVTPDVAIEGLGKTSSLAFDTQNNLWVLNYDNNQLLKYTSTQITTSGSPNPAAAINLEGNFDQSALAFNPAPKDLPINQ